MLRKLVKKFLVQAILSIRACYGAAEDDNLARHPSERAKTIVITIAQDCLCEILAFCRVAPFLTRVDPFVTFSRAHHSPET
jgi:hypothetical protein